MPRKAETFYIKGRFLGQPITGVERYAREMVDALDRLLDEPSSASNSRFVVAVPNDVPDQPRWKNISVKRGRLTGHAWEQIELPFVAAGGKLITLGGMPPVATKRGVSVLHDAGVFDIPEAYGNAFRSSYRISYKAAARRNDRLITVSEFSRNRLAPLLGKPADSFAVIPCGADHVARFTPDQRIFEKFPELREKPYVLSVGSAAPHKNFRIIDEAAARLSTQGIRFVVVGKLQGRAFSAQQSASSQFLPVGYVSDGELAALYQAAACYVFPSLYEGFGIPAIEAMALGCPVIASNRSALPATCGDAAVLFDPESVDDLCQSLTALLGSRTRAGELRAAGLARARQFSWENSARAFLHLLCGAEEQPQQ